MKIRQQQLPLDDEYPTLASIKFGECFKLMNGSEIYIKMTPVKTLLHSTMLYEVVTRGDFFALNLLTNIFTILPQGADRGTAVASSNTSSSKSK